MAGFLELVKDRPDAANMLFFLNHNADFLACSTMLPCLTARRELRIWSVQHQRLLLPIECMWAMGLPRRPDCVDARALREMARLGELFPLAGNGFHVPCVGAVMTWLLATHGPQGRVVANMDATPDVGSSTD